MNQSNINIPKGLTKCQVCGEYNGKVRKKDLNSVNPALQEELKESKGYSTVTCLCDGIPCPYCKKTQIHQPISNTYDAETNTVWHHPWFSAQAGCDNCRKQKYNPKLHP